MPSIPEVRSQNGLVSFDLDAVVDHSHGVPSFAYRGAIGVAPTIRVQPGDEIRVTLHNRLPAGGPAPNDVNLHFHGLDVSPVPPSDDAMRLAAPGGSVSYDIRVPRSQPPGLSWYHPHAHGQTYWQVTSGMSGAIIVEGLQQRLPALAAMRERLIMLRNLQTPADFSGIPIAARPERIRAAVLAGRKRAGRRTPIDDDDAMGQPCGPVDGMTVTLNGTRHATIGIDPGERQLFRIVNASAGRYFDLSDDGRPLLLVAVDGAPLGSYPGSPAVQRVRDVVIPPAGRAEFIVTGAREPTTLKSLCYTSGSAGDRDPEVDLADLRPDGRAPHGSMFDAPIVEAPGAASDARPRALPIPVAHRRIVFSEDTAGFYINARRYSMGDAPSIVARSGTIEEWQLVNSTDEVHDFHIHQIHFVVESIGGHRAAPYRWVDTVTVPPKTYTHTSSKPGTATVLMDFRDPAIRGTFVFHCHILDHEDGGMMSAIRVI